MATSYGSSPRDNDKSCAKSNSRKTFSYEPTCNKKCNEPSIKPCSKTSSSVNFVPKENVDKREKYLTAKYGVHQMAFIKKRLVVEMWLFDELSRLYCTENSDYDCNLELEDLLNFTTDEERREYAMQMLAGAKETPGEVLKFVNDLLKKAKTL